MDGMVQVTLSSPVQMQPIGVLINTFTVPPLKLGFQSA